MNAAEIIEHVKNADLHLDRGSTLTRDAYWRCVILATLDVIHKVEGPFQSSWEARIDELKREVAG